MVVIRQASAADAAELLEIYAQFIDTPVTFETELPSAEEFSRRIRAVLEGYPYLVCERDGRTVGYAYAHRFRERPAYRWGAELSVYLSREAQGRGLGKALYTALCGLLRLQNIQTVYGCVTLPNARSEALHRSLGFRTVGVFHNSGYKCGRWHDVVWYEKQLGEYEAAPAELLALPKVGEERVRALLAEARLSCGGGAG